MDPTVKLLIASPPVPPPPPPPPPVIPTVTIGLKPNYDGCVLITATETNGTAWNIGSIRPDGRLLLYTSVSGKTGLCLDDRGRIITTNE